MPNRCIISKKWGDVVLLQILIVEDEKPISNLIKNALSKDGYA